MKSRNLVEQLLTSKSEFDIKKISESIVCSDFDTTHFIETFQSCNENLNLNHYNSVSISGSGGSGIRKPNIGSISSLYISSLKIVSVVKIGSCAKTSLSGSTDLFTSIGFRDDKIKKNALDKYNFAYYDIDSISPWKKFVNFLSLNPAFYNMIQTHIFNEIKFKVKLTGVLSQSMYDDYSKRKHINKSDKLITYWSKLNSKGIDEIMQQNTVFACNNDIQKIDFGNIRKENNVKNFIDCNRVNMQLINGEDTTSIWYESLKYTVAFSLVEIEIADSIEHGVEIFDEIYTDKNVKRMLNDLHCV